MDDQYTEVLLKKRNSLPERPIKTLLIIVAALLLVFGIFFLPALITGVVLVILMILVIFPRLSQEVEYLYVNGSLDIDTVYSRQKRKNIASYDLLSAEVVAPVGSHHLSSYQNANVIDHSSGFPDRNVYAVVLTDGNQIRHILIEPNEVMLKDLSRRMPRKVFLA